MVPKARSKAVGRLGPVGKDIIGPPKAPLVRKTTTWLLGNGSDAPSPSFTIPRAIANGSKYVWFSLFRVLSWNFIFGFGWMVIGWIVFWSFGSMLFFLFPSCKLFPLVTRKPINSRSSILGGRNGSHLLVPVATSILDLDRIVLIFHGTLGPAICLATTIIQTVHIPQGG
jgi:hypothetical protein